MGQRARQILKVETCNLIQGDSSVAYIIPGVCLIENEMISSHSCLPNEDVE